MAVSCTAFLAGIDAEIRTVITAMIAERSSAVGLIASVRFTPLVLTNEIAALQAEILKIQGACVCPQCGMTLPEGTAFCSQCGASIVPPNNN